MTVALVTAIYDGYDSLKPVAAQSGPVEAICVTDDPALACGAAPTLGWRIVYAPNRDVHPNRAAKTPKMCPWRYTDAASSVWVDATMHVTSPTFVTDVLDLADPIAQFTHPWRDCIYDEADASRGLPKYVGEPMLEQVEHYQLHGHPAHWGLWATGVIARHHTPAVIAQGVHWLGECNRWSYQDQLSEPPTLRASNLRPDPIPGDVYGSEWHGYTQSRRH